MNRTEQRQLMRSLGWRGSKAQRHRRYARPEFRPPEEPAETVEPEE